MKHKKQQYIPILQPGYLNQYLAPNRKTARTLKKLGKKFTRVSVVVRVENIESFKEFRREIARKHGSQTGQLKKKHINRERQQQFIDMETSNG